MDFMMAARPLHIPQRLSVASVSNASAASQDQFGALVGYYRIYASGGGGGGGGGALVGAVVYDGERGSLGQNVNGPYIFLAQNVMLGAQTLSPSGGAAGFSPGVSGDDTATNGSQGGQCTIRLTSGTLALAIGGAGGRAGKISPATSWNPTPAASVFPYESDIGGGGHGADNSQSSEAGQEGRTYLVKYA